MVLFFIKYIRINEIKSKIILHGLFDQTEISLIDFNIYNIKKVCNFFFYFLECKT